MKKFFKMFGTAGLVAGMLIVGGCGSSDSDSASQPLGKVVKGPVVGAEVKDSTGKIVGTTDAKGNFPMTGTGPYTTTGGTYVPLKADGTAGTPIPAPPMSAPIGVSQITPLSTLVQTATAAAASGNAAAVATLANILAVINANGGLSTDLSVKTVANSALLNLSETVGAVLATINTPSVSTSEASATITALITAVASLPAAVITPAQIVTNVINNAQVTAALPTAVAAAVTLNSTTASTGTTAAPLGSLPITGSTGGTPI